MPQREGCRLHPDERQGRRTRAGEGSSKEGTTNVARGGWGQGAPQRAAIPSYQSAISSQSARVERPPRASRSAW